MTRKKISSFVKVFALCAATALTALYCTSVNHNDDEEDPTECHVWGDWTTTTDATCDAAGSQKKSCTKHGTVPADDSVKTIPKLSGEACTIAPTDCQQWGNWTITTPATCEAAGVETKICTQQGTVAAADSTKPIPQLTGETCDSQTECKKWSEWTVTTEATCEANGVESRTCIEDDETTMTRPIPKLTGETNCPTTPTGFTITFDPNGGTLAGSESGTTNANGFLESLPPQPTRDNHNFQGWYTAQVGGESVGTTMKFPANATIYARWELKPFTLTISANPEAGGTITRSPDAQRFNEDETVTITAEANAAYMFINWTRDENAVSTENVLTVTITGNTNITANFIKTYTLTVSANPEAGGTVTRSPDSPRYGHETEVTVTAEALDGYIFTHWTAGTAGVELSNENTITVTMVRDSALTAHFTKGFIDARNNKKYRAVTIGTQTWMAENLSYQTTDSWCYGGDLSNCNNYGRLYTWDDAKAACPTGWHLPTDEDWDALIKHIDPAHISGIHITAGNKLKSTFGWDNDDNGTDDYGFSALPGGYRRSIDGAFLNVGRFGGWWSTTELNDANANLRGIDYHSEHVILNAYSKTDALSVRCVQTAD